MLSALTGREVGGSITRLAWEKLVMYQPQKAAAERRTWQQQKQQQQKQCHVAGSRGKRQGQIFSAML
jgi:hypothetical protein